MNINTVEISTIAIWQSEATFLRKLRSRSDRTRKAIITCNPLLAIALLLALVSASQARATAVLGPWVPLFKGIDHRAGTNTVGGGGFTSLQVVHAVRIDLGDPDIRLFTTPRITNYVAGYRETAGFTVSNFLTANVLQVAVNANNFHTPGTLDSPSYTLPAGTPLELGGLAISEGEIVSTQESSTDSASILFTTNNQPTVIPTNWPAHSTTGFYNAVSGLYSILVNGVNVGSNYLGSSVFVHQAQPRTALGVSQDRRYLYMITIDGRQSGYSDGALDWETAAWLLMVGGWDGVNMDGGGSTTMVMADSTGRPVELNRSSAIADPGTRRERTIGSHLGIFARPLSGFINDVIALPDDNVATITWTTTLPATTQVKYGLSTNLNSSSPLLSAMVTNHAALLTGLAPNTGYYFAVVSQIGGNYYISSNYYFVTTNYVVTNALMDLTNTWKFTTGNLDGVNWSATNYDDSNWEGTGAGLFWVDTLRGAPNPDILAPMNTLMPSDPNTGFPFMSYYFRTQFNFTNGSKPASLIFSNYVDDGAVFYLNGAEIYRVRMDPLPTPISNNTLATNYPCAGDATCADYFEVAGDLTTNLMNGDNVLAVEVHNYDPGSPDITFGTALRFTTLYTLPPELSINFSNGKVELRWSRGGFTLQQAFSPTGPWSNVPGPIVSSPYTSSISGSSTYFRLQK